MIKKIKNNLIMMGMVVLSFPSFSQNISLNEINHQISDEMYATAKNNIKDLSSDLPRFNQDEKLYYYYLSTLVNTKGYLSNPSLLDYRKDAIESFKTINDYQNSNKLLKYSKKTIELQNQLLASIINKSIQEMDNKNYTVASDDFYDAYLLSKKDTVFLYQSAGAALNAKMDSVAISRYKELINLNFNGTFKSYVATNIATGLVESFGNDFKTRDEKVKRGLFTKPAYIEEKSKKADVYKKLSLIYINKSNYSEGEFYLVKAQELNPDDYELYIALFYMYMNTNRLYKFVDYKEKALKNINDQNRIDLFYNIGVVYYNLDYKDLAKKYFLEGLALAPNDYLLNKAIGSIMFDIDKKVSDQINALSDTRANKIKREELILRKKENYQEIINYFKRAYSSNNSDTGLKEMIINLEKYLH